ncbi:MAG: hypothetical protein QME94_10245 [Anaerolineae bacterium]|nr:hypothetical protein [Anaerolineae bacterium]
MSSLRSVRWGCGRTPWARSLASAVLAASLLLGELHAATVASAAGPVTIPHGPLPVEELKPVEFSALAVDVTISPAGSGVGLEVRTRTNLRNPERKASFERRVAFGDPPVTGVRIGTQNSGLRPAEGDNPWLLTLAPEGDAIIEGTQHLSAPGPLVELGFDWAALAPWGSPLGAVRLTLRFSGGVDSEQLLAVDPAPTQRDTLQLTWSYEKHQPTGRVRVFFVAPQYWQALQKARRAAAQPEAAADAFLAVAAAARPLAEAVGMPEPVAEALEGECLAALRQAVAVAPGDARTHAELGSYLRARAQGSPSLLAEAVSQLKAAYDLAPGDAQIRQQLLSALEEQMAACRQAADRRGLLAALDIAEAIGVGSSPERAAGYADLAIGLLEAGRLDEAEATIAAGFGQEALAPLASLRPRYASVTAEVETHTGRRTVRCSLVAAPGMEEEAQQGLDALVEALSRTGSVEVARSGEGARTTIELVIPFQDSEGLRAASLSVAQALPADADPALLLVTAIGGPGSIAYESTQGRRADHLIYVEHADLTPAQRALERVLERLRAARAEAEAQTDDPIEAARRRWVLALVKRYEADWLGLARGCRATYRLLPPEDIIAPQWALAWGEQRELAWSTTIPRPERLVPYVAGLAAVLLALMAGVAIWHWRRSAGR